MSSLALMEVQRALHTKLQGDGVLMGMVSGVYDAVPQKTPLPYVVIGDGQMRELPAATLTINELTLQIDVWTASSGRKTALAIMNRLFALLHLGTLTLDGLQQVILRCTEARTELAEQATHMHGTMNLRVTVAEV
ncbi:MAG: DUF3168 domain-containing protein [Alphaproteobacteria bacterium]|nr:DUF3168 domain-containing protein [Alphaproteobacteria bacterium]